MTLMASRSPTARARAPTSRFRARARAFMAAVDAAVGSRSSCGGSSRRSCASTTPCAFVRGATSGSPAIGPRRLLAQSSERACSIRLVLARRQRDARRAFLAPPRRRGREPGPGRPGVSPSSPRVPRFGVGDREHGPLARPADQPGRGSGITRSRRARIIALPREGYRKPFGGGRSTAKYDVVEERFRPRLGSGETAAAAKWKADAAGRTGFAPPPAR